MFTIKCPQKASAIVEKTVERTIIERILADPHSPTKNMMTLIGFYSVYEFSTI